MAFASGRSPLADSAERVQRMRLQTGTSRIELAAERIEEGRTAFLDAMKVLDSSEDRGLHVRVEQILNEVDDLRAMLAERHRS